MDKLIVKLQQLPTDQFLITAAQFVAENYAEKIARGECKVYFFQVEPPPEDATASEKAAYRHLLTNGGLFDEIGSIDRDGEAYISHGIDGFGTMLFDGNRQLLVITNERWQTIE